ncbi:MAG: DUF4365 domain-containing protein, partial [Pseudolabrys sp.]|nr:DUF4365 domain-containing protein [Pseudolabrys sp.]
LDGVTSASAHLDVQVKARTNARTSKGRIRIYVTRRWYDRYAGKHVLIVLMAVPKGRERWCQHGDRSQRVAILGSFYYALAQSMPRLASSDSRAEVPIDVPASQRLTVDTLWRLYLEQVKRVRRVAADA